MAGSVRRTKAQKIKSQLHVQQKMSYSYVAPSQATPGASKAPVQSVLQVVDRTPLAKELFGYDLRLVFHDLRTTIAVAFGIIIILAGLSVYLR